GEGGNGVEIKEIVASPEECLLLIIWCFFYSFNLGY
ncbi:hypothetical protein GASC598B02_002150, partial [Gilliamella apicola SCGC AB-598-B02]